MKFECRTTVAPRPGKKTIKMSTEPMNLDEMLKVLRQMGFKPEDVSVGPLTYEYEYGSVTYA